MSTPCKNEYEIKRRLHAFKRLGNIKGFEAGLPCPEIFGINLNKKGLLKIKDLLRKFKN
jgi:hypothetical protein